MSAKILGIDIGSTKICAAMAELNASNEVSIIAVSCAESKGIKKGEIKNIELAASSIQTAVNDVLRIAGTNYNKVIVSINGKSKNLDSKGMVNIPNKDVTISQIERLMQDLCYRAKIEYEYEAIHVLPYNFKLDDQDNIEDPLGMSGSRLEVEAQIITVQRAAVVNLRKAIEKAGLRADNIVLCGYASSIATLNEDEKQLGAALIDMGGATCNMVIHAGNSIRYSEFLGVGSTLITTDLSAALHTPIAKAEEVKIKYGSLRSRVEGQIDLPDIGDENASRSVSVSIVQDVIMARVDETMRILAEMLGSSNYRHLISAGVVLTGGMTKIEGLREIATLIFDRLPVRIARPSDIEGLDDRFKEPMYSCAIGLCLYGAGHFTPYEIDSERKMRYHGESDGFDENGLSQGAEFAEFGDNEPMFEETEVNESLNLRIENEVPQKAQKAKNYWTDKVINKIKNLF